MFLLDIFIYIVFIGDFIIITYIHAVEDTQKI